MDGPTDARAEPRDSAIPFSELMEEIERKEREELDFENLAVRTGTVLPGIGQKTIKLSAEREKELARELCEAISAHDRAMRDRLVRERKIADAYNLVPDPQRQGQKPDASRLVSEMTRSQVNIATARITEGIMGIEPFILVEVADDQAKDTETVELVAAAQQTQDFLSSYSQIEMEAEGWIPRAVHRAVKLGTTVVRVMWEVVEHVYRYLDSEGNLKPRTESIGKVSASLIPSENFILWPLDQTEIDKAMIAGHKHVMLPCEFREFAEKKQIDSELKKKLLDLARAGGDQRPEENKEADLKGKDIDVTDRGPFSGTITICELWCHMSLPGRESEGRHKFQVFLHQESERILWIGFNTLNAQRHPYFEIPYWREDGSFWGSGVGHECMYPQAADSALMNLQIDNLKVIANHVRLFKADSGAEAMRDQVAPGFDIVTENPAEDFLTVPLGGDLSHIYEAMDRNDMRKINATGITMPVAGMGDPVLKSGASPTSIGQLLEAAGKKFGQVDRNMRNGFSRIYFFILELYQQFAPDGLFYLSAAEEGAQRLKQLRFLPPKGDLRKLFRITARAPSAASSKEMLKQNLMLVYNLLAQHFQASIALATDAWGQTDPYRLLRLKEQYLELFEYLFAEILKHQEVPGLSAKVPAGGEPTPIAEFIAGLVAELEKLQSELQNKEMQMQALQAQAAGVPMGGGNGGAPMGPPQPGPQLPGPV